MNPAPEQPSRGGIKAYLVGGGIASLASAAYLIRDGGIAGEHISILEATNALGGSLDGEGSLEHPYVIRGGRMFTEEAYTCLFDLLSFIPSLAAPGQSVKEEVYEFNSRIKSHSRSRLVKNGVKIDASAMGFSTRDRLALGSILVTSEQSLGATRIQDLFDPAFFQTNFWYMWCTTFAFQPWHSAVELKRYLLRFIQEFPRIHTLGGVRRTPYNQYDSIVLPVTTWLKQRGVQFVLGAKVTGLDFAYGPNGKGVEQIRYVRDGGRHEIAVGSSDLVFVTNGSMTAASSLGSMTDPPRQGATDEGGSWALWEALAKVTPAMVGLKTGDPSDIARRKRVVGIHAAAKRAMRRRPGRYTSCGTWPHVIETPSKEVNRG